MMAYMPCPAEEPSNVKQLQEMSPIKFNDSTR